MAGLPHFGVCALYLQFTIRLLNTLTKAFFSTYTLPPFTPSRRQPALTMVLL